MRKDAEVNTPTESDLNQSKDKRRETKNTLQKYIRLWQTRCKLGPGSLRFPERGMPEVEINLQHDSDKRTKIYIRYHILRLSERGKTWHSSWKTHNNYSVKMSDAWLQVGSQNIAITKADVSFTIIF